MNILMICRLGIMAFACLQSLADVAQEEAQRRKLLDQQGIEAKVISGKAADLGANGNVTVSDSPVDRTLQSKSPVKKEQASLRRYRSALQRLDRSVRQNEDRLRQLRARKQDGRIENQKLSQKSEASNANAQDRLREQIEDIEIKLKQLQDERFETYEAGKKDGFLPGELEGTGMR